MFNSQAITASDFFKFREDKYTFLFSSANTKSEFFESIFNSFKKSFKPFVLGLSKEKSSTTLIEFDLALMLSADFLAMLFVFLFIF